MIDKIKKHWFVSILIAIAIPSLIYMYLTDTLSYPYVLVSRQIQMIKYCYLGNNEFTTKEYGFSVSVPGQYCFLPNRIFPDDGSVHVLPKGGYFVINEYATGSVLRNAKSTLLFEPIASDRNTPVVLDALKKGGFLVDAKITEIKNKNGIKITLVHNVRGIDESKHFDWAFIDHPNGKIFLSVLLANTEDKSVFNYILDNLKAI